MRPGKDCDEEAIQHQVGHQRPRINKGNVCRARHHPDGTRAPTWMATRHLLTVERLPAHIGLCIERWRARREKHGAVSVTVISIVTRS